MDKLKGYRTYIFLAAGFVACVLKSRAGVDIPQEIIIGLFVVAGIALRSAVSNGNGEK